MTEFGSDRYLEKFNQSQANAATGAGAAPTAALPQSQFILPLRGASLSEAEGGASVKAAEQKRSERRSFGFLRNKFHVRSSSAAIPGSVGHSEQAASSSDSTTARQR